MKKISEFFKSVKNIVIIALIVLVVLLGINVFKNFNVDRESEFEVSAVLEKIKQVSQLDTVEMYFNEILDYREALKIKDFEIPFTKKSFIFIVKAKVQAGIDLASLSEENIKIEDKKITLLLDKATITSKEVIEYQAYAEKDGLFNKVTNEDTLNTLNEFLLRLNKQAKDNGILQLAEDNAKVVLDNILTLVGFEEIIITYN